MRPFATFMAVYAAPLPPASWVAESTGGAGGPVKPFSAHLGATWIGDARPVRDEAQWVLLERLTPGAKDY